MSAKQLLNAIYAGYENQFGGEPPREHLGASIIGRPCSREIWYQFRWAGRETFSGRMLRLFQSGHLQEPRLIEDLRRIGVTVLDKDPGGKQWSFSVLGGHFSGSMDSALLGIPGDKQNEYFGAEYKTSSEKKWIEVAGQLDKDHERLTGERVFTGGKGVKTVKPEHYVQMNQYMGHLSLRATYYFMVNKNTDDVYVEYVEFDEANFNRNTARAEQIIAAVEPPQRMSKDPSWRDCKYCVFKQMCHGTRAPLANCRTCAYATPEMDGDKRWSCGLHKRDLTAADQLAGCDGHRYIPALLEKIGVAVESRGDAVVYRHHNGNTFVNGNAPGEYTSAEIFRIGDTSLLGNQDIDTMKSTFGATVIG